MQRIRLERLARSFFGDALQRAGAKKIDDDGDGDDGEGGQRRLDRIGLLAKEPLHGLEGDARCEQKQQSRFSERRHAFDLAVAILMLGVGRLAGNAHRDIGQHRSGEVEQ